MLQIEIENLEVEIHGQPLFTADHLSLHTGEKIGLVGRNGCGKTTLLRLLIGELPLERGKGDILTDYLYVPQMECAPNGRGETRLSGGQAQLRRVKQALSGKAPLVILDEPTAHLDETGAKEIERLLAGYPGSLLIVSHDRALLSEVCTGIWEIDDGKLQAYDGNYDAYERVKREREMAARQAFSAYKAEKQRLRHALLDKQHQSRGVKRTPKRFGNSEARLHKMGGQNAKKKLDQQAKALKSRLEQLEPEEKPKEAQPVHIRVPDALRLYAKYPLTTTQMDVFAGEKKVLSNVAFQLEREQRAGILGNNGSGKTSFLRAIAARKKGVCLAGAVRLGYFRQDLRLLDDSKSVLLNLMADTCLLEWETRGLLAAMGVPGERMHSPAGVLSGGERVKASLLKVITGGNNLLLLDEPTNYLDIPSLKALEKALIYCDKPMVIVSHDRSFMEKVCTCFWVCAGGKLERRREAAAIRKDELAVLALRQTALLSKLCMAKDEGEKEALEREYEAITSTLKQMKPLGSD